MLDIEQIKQRMKCSCYSNNKCNCPQKNDYYKIFMMNVEDIAESLSEIMIICGIHPCKAKAAIDVIVRAFAYYDEIRNRIDTIPRKRLRKEDLILDLGKKCLMTRIEAQLSFSIVKRAFKAFYYGTAEYGIRNPFLQSQLIHTNECLWVHAAKRTAQVFASYEGMFFSAQQYYESQIMCIYKSLYGRLVSRSTPAEKKKCTCTKCPQPETEADNISILLSESSTSLTPETELPRCTQCNYPKLICECKIPAGNVLSPECSQGPFTCRWIQQTEEDLKKPKKYRKPEEHECPIDCDPDSSCDSECICDCEECVCECEESEEEFSEIDDYDDSDEIDIGEMEEMELEIESEDTICKPIPLARRQPNPLFGDCYTYMGKPEIKEPPPKEKDTESTVKSEDTEYSYLAAMIKSDSFDTIKTDTQSVFSLAMGAGTLTPASDKFQTMTMQQMKEAKKNAKLMKAKKQAAMEIMNIVGEIV